MMALRSLRRKFSCKIYEHAQDAVEDIRHRSSICIGGYGACGVPENLVKALSELGSYDLHVYSLSAAIPDFGVNLLLKNRQVKKLSTSHIGHNKLLNSLYMSGELELEMLPDGTLTSKVRSGGAGIPGFYIRTGVDTVVEEGNYPLKYLPGGKRVEIYSTGKEKRRFEKVDCLFEESILPEFAFVKAWKADTAGNLIYKRTAKNINPDIATCARVTIAEVEEIVPEGELDPDEIDTSSIFVKRLIKGENYQKPIVPFGENEDPNNPAYKSKCLIAKRASKELEDGMYVHLGLGMPYLVSNYVPEEKTIFFHSTPGVLGMWTKAEGDSLDPDIIDSNHENIKLAPGSACFSANTSMDMIRAGHLDLVMSGALEVSQNGDLSNWVVPGVWTRGIGSTMDAIASKESKIVVLTQHSYKGKPKLKKECSYPLTGKRCVDTVITEKAVFEFKREGGMTLTEKAPGVSLEDIKRNTPCRFQVASDLKDMDLS